VGTRTLSAVHMSQDERRHSTRVPIYCRGQNHVHYEDVRIEGMQAQVACYGVYNCSVCNTIPYRTGPPICFSASKYDCPRHGLRNYDFNGIRMIDDIKFHNCAIPGGSQQRMQYDDVLCSSEQQEVIILPLYFTSAEYSFSI